MKRLALILLIVLPLAAQSKHLVSRIDVRGNVPAHIVTSQSALVEGRSYSDKDLEVAMARLRRLPFVYDAQYSMEGEVLVIEIDAVSRFFGDLDANGIGFENDQTGNARIGAGGRMFLGSGGVAQLRAIEYVSEGNDSGAVDAEYSHYGIAGSRLFASAGIEYEALHDERYNPDPSYRLSVGYPINVRNTITATATDQGASGRRSLVLAPRDLFSFTDRQTLNVLWTYDTADDPFFARTGLTVNAGPSWSRDESQFESYSLTFPDLHFDIITTRSDSRSTSLGANAMKFWSTGTRGALMTGASFAFDHAKSDETFGTLFQENEFDARTGTLFLGYAHNLFDRLTDTATRQRLELGAAYTRSKVDTRFFTPFDNPITLDSTTLSANYVLRRQFATVRLGVSYAFD